MKNLIKLCTTINNSFVLEQMLQEYEVNVIEREDNNLGSFAYIDPKTDVEELQHEFFNQTNHTLIIC